MRRRVPAAIAAVALAITGVAIGVQYALPGPAGADEYTVSQNVSRDGWDSNEPALSPAAVTAKSFGQIFDTKVNGQVYAQPLNVGNSVIVATENDYVYSINRNTGAVNWSRQLGSPYAATAEQCTEEVTISPYVGVTSTPVYDPTTGTLYVSGMVSGPPGDDSDLSTTSPQDVLFAINEAHGTVDWSQTISGSPTDDSQITFDAANELQRPGLLLLNGSVYMGFGSLCEDGAADHDYEGFIAGVNTKTEAKTLWSDQSVDPVDAGGIWQGGGGLVTDGKSIYFSTGNGTVPAAGLAGSSAASAGDFGQSVVEVTPQANGTLQPTNFFSPGNADELNGDDHDLGSGGPVELPFTTKDYPKGLMVMAGKDARLFLLNEASLGGRSSSETGSTAVFTGSPSLVDDPSTNGGTAHGLWGHMAAFAGSGGDDYIYYQGAGWGNSGPMYVLKFNGANPAKPVLENIGQTALQFGFSSGSPVITSNAASAASAIVWEVYTGYDTGEYASLNAYSAVPTSKGVLQKIWSAPIGAASQFSVPATSDGRVYVGARNDSITGTSTTATCPVDFESPAYTSTDGACVGEVYGFGTYSAALTGSTVNLGHVALGQSVTKTVTLTNTGDTPTEITNITTPSVPFGTPVKPAFDQPVAPGASVTFPVTFTPQANGTITGKYVVTSTDGYATHTTTVAVGGVGAPAASGTQAVPSPGGGWTLNGSSTMTGTTLQLTPAKAGQVGSAVFYQPVLSNNLYARFSARLSGGNGGDGMTFSLLNPASATTARGAGAGELGYGGLSGVSVVLGTRKDAGDPSANFVGIATGTSGGHLVFAATSTKVPNLRSGTHVITVTVVGKKVTVEVNGKGYVSATVPIASTVLPAFTAANGSGADIHAVSGAYITTPGTSTLPSPGGNWSYNGTAAMAAAATTLTTATGANQAGAVVYPHAVTTSSFRATFNVALGGGTGGDGMTLALLNPGTAATAVGGHGTDLGFAGLNGLAVVLGTTPTTISGGTSSDYVAVETSTAGGTPTLVASKDLTGSINLRSGTHMVTVSLKAGMLTVAIDGTTVLTQSVTVPSSAYVAFTGSTGSLTDRHLVQNAAIAAG
ncbi:MAG: legume lectin beta domain protein [Actinomycetia bacterium]|nr:legume lectin beta domain protein [Actinomycetes bacterium]